jgi:hypothetical protein
MVGKQLVQFRKLRKDIIFCTPIHGGSVVNPDLLGRKPFGATGKTERPGRAGESAQSIPGGPTAALYKAVIIMCLAIMNQQADARVLANNDRGCDYAPV